MKTILAAVTALLLTTATASAATMFNFSGGGGLASSYSFTEDGITVEATPGTFSNGGAVTPGGWIGQYGGGLGVTNSIFDNTHQVDGLGLNDIVIFKFDQVVTLNSVTFSLVGNDDHFSFFFDNEPDGDLDLISSFVNIPGTGTTTYTFNSTWTGMLFGIGAKGSDDEFKIKGAMVTAIPLPAALPLYGAGIAILGLIGWIRKRRE